MLLPIPLKVNKREDIYVYILLGNDDVVDQNRCENRVNTEKLLLQN